MILWIMGSGIASWLCYTTISKAVPTTVPPISKTKINSSVPPLGVALLSCKYLQDSREGNGAQAFHRDCTNTQIFVIVIVCRSNHVQLEFSAADWAEGSCSVGGEHAMKGQRQVFGPVAQTLPGFYQDDGAEEFSELLGAFVSGCVDFW